MRVDIKTPLRIAVEMSMMGHEPAYRQWGSAGLRALAASGNLIMVILLAALFGDLFVLPALLVVFRPMVGSPSQSREQPGAGPQR